MVKAFNLFLWENEPSVNTPLGETLLNKVNVALNEVDNRVITHETTKANQSDLLTALADVMFDENTGVITFTKKNGSTTQIDTKLEKLAINFAYDAENQQLVIKLEDGTIQYVDMKALITELEFLDSNTVLFSVTDGKVTANIAKGSITADMLEPNYLANVQLYASQALSNANSAKESAVEAESYTHGGTGTREGEDTDNAKYYMEQTKAIAGADLESILNGTTPVGNALKLNGLTAEEFVSNYNLLINPELEIDRIAEVISESTTTSFTVAKNWKVVQNGTCSVEFTDDGIKLTNVTPNTYLNLEYSVSDYPLEDGVYTFSFYCDKPENIRQCGFGSTHCTIVSGNGFAFKTNGNIVTTTFELSDITGVRVFIQPLNEVCDITIKWAKIEPGSVATPFIPPNKEVEKLKCGGFIAGALGSQITYYPISTNKDCNDITEFLVVGGGVDGLHYPSANNYYYIFTMTYDDNEKKQIAIGYSAVVMNDIVFRTCKDGTWNAWSNTNDGGNADTVDGYHASEFVLASGAKKVQLGSETNTEDIYVTFRNTNRHIRVRFTPAGNLIVDDSTNSKELYRSANDGTTTIHGTASGNLPLDGKMAMSGNLVIQGSDGSKVKVKSYGMHNGSFAVYNTSDSEANGRELILRDSASSVTNGLLKALVLRDNVDGVTTDYTVLHNGNSTPVSIGTSAPSDTTSLWYDTTNKVLKRYVDGAWQA